MKLFNERAESKIVFVQVCLGNYFVGRVHRDYGYADVDGANVHIRNELCNRAAAALVNLTKFARLPNNAVVVEQFTKVTDKFRVRIVRTALTARTGEFGYACAVGNVSGVMSFANVREVGIEACVYVRGKTHRLCTDCRGAYAEGSCNFVH